MSHLKHSLIEGSDNGTISLVFCIESRAYAREPLSVVGIATRPFGALQRMIVRNTVGTILAGIACMIPTARSILRAHGTFSINVEMIVHFLCRDLASLSQ
jgi:hypothetical protein